MSDRLGLPAIPAALAAARPGLDAVWTVRDDRLHRHVQTPDFASSLALAVRIGAIADELDHHPDLAVRWGALEIAIWTHTAGGVTRLDVEFAARCEALLTAT